MTEYNNFELLLTLACHRYAQESAESYLSMDTSNISVSEREHKRAMKIIKAAKRKRVTPWSVIKYSFVACLLIMSICFTACMCIPKVRQAITDAFIEWYDSYIAVSFTPSATPMEGEALVPPESTGSNVSTESNGKAIEKSTDNNAAAVADVSTAATTETSSQPAVEAPKPNPTTIEQKANVTVDVHQMLKWMKLGDI